MPMAQAFVSEVDEGHPFQIAYEDELPLEVSESKANIDFLFNIPSHHHLYKHSIKVEINNSKVDYDLIKPNGVIKFDDFMGEETEVFYNQALVILKLKFSHKFDFSEDLTGNLYYQGCSKKICYRVVKIPFKFELNVVSPPTKEALKTEKSIFTLLKTTQFEDLLQEGFLFAILITFLAGLFTGFTPCVLPIIPLTLAFIGASDKTNKKTRFINLLIFVSGMVLMYSVLGVLSAALGLTLGFFYQNSLFLVFLIVFLLIMALWLLGVFSFSIPSHLQNKIARYQPKGKFRFIYSGLTIGLLASPCVGPILGPLLVYISATNNLLLGFVMMLSYSLGLSVLFFILGFFSSSWVKRFGRASDWIKKGIAVLLLLTAIYFSWVLIGSSFKSIDKNNDGFFLSDLEQAKKVAVENNKGLLIDFTADWCLPCHEWDKKVWRISSIRDEVSKAYVPVKIDCTKETKECEAAIEQFKVVGWPTILFLDEKLLEIKKARIVGSVMSSEDFFMHLEEIEQNY